MSKLVNFAAVLTLVTGFGANAASAQLASPARDAQPSSWKLASVEASKLAVSNDSISTSSSEASASAAIVAVPQPLPTRNSNAGYRVRPFSRIAISTRTGTLGVGAQVATPITRWLNLRGGFDLFNYNYGLTNDGANYSGDLHMKSGMVSADIFPFHRSGFHVSPGLLIFKTRAGASLNVPGGNTFSMGDNTFTSDPSNPVTGTGTLNFARSMMPALTFGFGNMIAREGRHWSVPLEIGAAYTGHTTAQIVLAGSACTQGYCSSVNDPSIQQSVTQEQNDINESTKHYQIYPIFTTGVSYRF